MAAAIGIGLGAKNRGLNSSAASGRQGSRVAPGERLRVAIFEKNSEPGKKILATGNGRCNLTNTRCDGFEDVRAFFLELGLLMREGGDGRLYPMSGQATSVRGALWECLTRMGTETRLEDEVLSVRATERTEIPFEINAKSGMHAAKRVIICAGGKAGPQHGSTGDSYAFARAMGHSVISPLPALVPMTCADAERPRLAALKGVRVKCLASLFSGGAKLGQSAGELQFTEYGLSGICILDLSRLLRGAEKNSLRVCLDFAPRLSESELKTVIGKNLPAGLDGILPAKLAALVAQEGRDSADALAGLIKNLTFVVSGTKGWKEAQVTAGGVPLDEIRASTMRSKLIPGLYFAGEALNYDGVCGGYNLNWAWLSGMKAGRAAFFDE
jgi:predicted Rossmann fold flavoprotein